MSVADVMAVLGPVGGAGGIAAAFKWYFDRAERLRKEQIELETNLALPADAKEPSR